MQIKVLANQLQAPHMIHAFNDATSIPHGYLLVNFKPNTPDYLRFRTHIFQNWFTKSDQQGPVVYFPGVKKGVFQFKSIICVKMAQQTSANLVCALYNLSREHDSHKRNHSYAGLIGMIKWFSLAARKIVQGKMKLPKQTQKFMDRHQDDVRKLASAIVDPEVKHIIILKPGGGGFFGGVIIRSLIRWMEIN